MAKPQERVFALVMALLFLATTVAGAAIVIWQVRQDNEQSKLSAQAQQLQDGANDLTQQEDNVEETKLNGFTPVAKVDSLQKTDLVEGTGEEVKPGATVSAKYTGAYASDGVVFDSSDKHGGQPISFSLDGVIAGWTQGVPGMKVGGKRRLLIPASLAYGANPPQGIRANADMVFDIEIVSAQ
jgi:FKBP-type peptidyl-prolyl cis-trans isomerase